MLTTRKTMAKKMTTPKEQNDSQKIEMVLQEKLISDRQKRTTRNGNGTTQDD